MYTIVFCCSNDYIYTNKSFIIANTLMHACVVCDNAFLVTSDLTLTFDGTDNYN